MTSRWRIGAQRDRAERYLVLTIAAFAVTVAGTRWYLDLAGYPTVGGGQLHVAHVLWGGLALFIAALLPLLYAGRRSLLLSAILAGIGAGLFIDEVGKFLTTTNDYFFAPAPPIIYGSILLLVLLWLLVRRRTPSQYDATHAALEALRDGIDGRLTPEERERAERLLEEAGPSAEYEDLSTQLLAALRSPAMDARLSESGWIARGDARRTLERILPTRLECWIVTIGLALSVLTALGATIALVAFQVSPDEMMFGLADSVRLEIPEDPLWVMLTMAVYVVTGLASAGALVMRLRGSRSWLDAALVAVLIDLVVGELVAFYALQFTALSATVISAIQLGLIIDLRIRRDAAAVDEASART